MRKIITRLLDPLFLILFLGMLLSFRKKTASFFALFLLIYALSITPVADKVIGLLEKGCPSYQKLPRLENIVLFSGGTYERKDEISSLGCSSGKRLLCALKLCGRLKNCRIIVLGGSISSSKKPESFYIKKIIQELKPSVKVISENKTRYTEEQALELKKILKDQPFFAVTSAYHMRRTIFLLRHYGLEAYPYCCDFQREKTYILTDFLPHPRNLRKVSLAFHELFGLLYYRFKFALSSVISSIEKNHEKTKHKEG